MVHLKESQKGQKAFLPLKVLGSNIGPGVSFSKDAIKSIFGSTCSSRPGLQTRAIGYIVGQRIFWYIFAADKAASQ